VIHLGLRARITVAVALVTLVLSVILSLVTLTVTSRTLISQREESVTRRVLANAQTVDGSLAGASTPDLQTVLSSLADAGKPSLILAGTGDTVAVSLDQRFGVDSLPRELKDRVVESDESGIQRFSADGVPLVAIGVPLKERGASYFEVYALDDIETGLRTLAITLAVATALTTIGAAALGYWASRYTLRPITRIKEAAESVALGQLDTRIDFQDYAHDRDLAPLVANFNSMVSALQERIDRDARFASDVSHELRSPLTTLNAGIQVLDNSRDDLPERARHVLDLLSADVDRFTQLVEDLLEISRFDAGAVRLELDDVALVPLVTTTLQNLGYGDVPVEADAELEDTVLACDKRRLIRILANYLNNAQKYADGPTGVFVERHDPDPDDPLDETTVRIGVEDAGPGVPVEERGRIFDRFNRGDQGGSRGADIGVGLGLALAAEHARLQGGRVWVEDRHDGGQGSRFVVELPLLEPYDEELEHDEDLSAATPEAASALTLTGEHSAITLDEALDDTADDNMDDNVDEPAPGTSAR
jgi:signal transduction histidine kinase